MSHVFDLFVFWGLHIYIVWHWSVMKECSDKDHGARGRPFWDPWSMVPIWLWVKTLVPGWYPKLAYGCLFPQNMVNHGNTIGFDPSPYVESWNPPVGDCTQRETPVAPWMLRRPCKAGIAAPGEVTAEQATQAWVGGTWCGTQFLWILCVNNYNVTITITYT